MRKLGRSQDAEAIFRELRDSARGAIQGTSTSVADTAPVAARQGHRDRLALAHFVAGLGHLGLGEADQARHELSETLAISPDHLGARTVLETLGTPRPNRDRRSLRTPRGAGTGKLKL